MLCYVMLLYMNMDNVQRTLHLAEFYFLLVDPGQVEQ